jgi:hypothetical protein
LVRIAYIFWFSTSQKINPRSALSLLSEYAKERVECVSNFAQISGCCGFLILTYLGTGSQLLVPFPFMQHHEESYKACVNGTPSKSRSRAFSNYDERRDIGKCVICSTTFSNVKNYYDHFLARVLTDDEVETDTSKEGFPQSISSQLPTFPCSKTSYKHLELVRPWDLYNPHTNFITVPLDFPQPPQTPWPNIHFIAI